MIRCLHCGAETSNGLALCELCQRAARLIFEYTPIYFRNLARWRPGRTGSRPVPGSRVLYDGPISDGTGDRISDRVDEAMNALTTWARTLVDDRPHFTRPLTLADAALLGELPDEIADDQGAVVTALCLAFEERLTSVSTLDWCGQFLRDLAHHEAVLRSLTETYIPGWYAGACKRCNVATYVIPGLRWVTCGGCGATTYARDHLDTILTEARPWVARPKVLAATVVALVDGEQSVPKLYDRIRQWEQRRKITAVRKLDEDGDAVGPKRYRLGEVLDRIRAEGPTRLNDDAPRTTAQAS